MSFSIVQSQSATASGAVASISATFGSTPTAPHLIAVMVQGLGGSGPTYTITDNHSPSNTYTSAAHAVLNTDGSGNNESLDIWILAPTAAQLNSGFAVTVTPSVSAYMSLTIAEVSFAGSPPTAGTPQSAASGGTSSTSIATPALSIASNSLVLYLASQFTVADPISPGIGSAIYQNTYASGTSIGFLSAYEANVATNATPSASMVAAANNWGIAGIALAENPIVLTGPTTGPVGSASTNFAITPSAAMSGTFTPTPVAGITFTPASLTWAASSAAQTFTATAASGGTYPITGTFDRGYTFSGGPINYTAGPTWPYFSTVTGLNPGLSTVGYQIIAHDGTVRAPRTTAGVVELGYGSYGAQVPMPFSGNYAVKWDDGGSPASGGVDPVSPLVVDSDGLNLAQFMGLLRAFTMGKAAGFGASGATAGQFLGADGSTARISGPCDQYGNRSTAPTLNPLV